jgi:hypothetical protein
MTEPNPRRREDVQAKRLESEWILYDTESGSLHVVNEMAHFVWGLCDGTLSRSDMARRIAESYQVPEGQDVSGDLEKILDEFGELGLLQTAG